MYFDAPVPHDGQTAFDFRPTGAPVPDVKRRDVIPARPVSAGGGLTDAAAEWINSRLVPQPVAPSMDPVSLTNELALGLPETYVFFTQTPPGKIHSTDPRRCNPSHGRS